MINLSYIKRFIILNFSGKKKIVSLIVLIIGVIEIAVSAILLSMNSGLDNVIRGVFILLYGGIEFTAGVAGFVLKFKSDYNRFAQITRYIIMGLLFIPYIAVIASLIIYDPILIAFRLNALILSLVSLINLTSIPIIKYLYYKET